MFLRIENSPKKKLVGMQRKMTFATIPQETPMLWKQFMPLHKSINNRVDANFYSLQVYDSLLKMNEVKGSDSFTKWALVEVADFDDIPKSMEEFNLEGGLYAVFLHKGLGSEFAKTMNYIFGEWLPKSDYTIDHRPHFELLGAKYKNNGQSSEEEVWIPIKEK
ncbi:MAG: GyrI-like domain-containing protein [Flavobacteriaceae bacterium]